MGSVLPGVLPRTRGVLRSLQVRWPRTFLLCCESPWHGWVGCCALRCLSGSGVLHDAPPDPLRPSFSGKPFDPTFVLSRSVSNIICSVIFGSRFDYDDERLLTIIRLINDNFQIMSGPWGEVRTPRSGGTAWGFFQSWERGNRGWGEKDVMDSVWPRPFPLAPPLRRTTRSSQGRSPHSVSRDTQSPSPT